ncbi:MAG: patatin-like phospholipase family protein [Alistipes putredinis]|nr:MAG: patatin-like phospholipase family protein [Alistipes putredinis]
MKRNVALVLASGGARGIAHIGAIKELEHSGYRISSVAGTSMGALIGGIYACGKNRPVRALARSADTPQGVRTGRFHALHLRNTQRPAHHRGA